MAVFIWAKLSDFVREYSGNISCEFYWNNLYGSTDTAVYTLKFTFSSEHTIAHWIFTNNESNFAELFINTQMFNDEYQVPIAHSVFKQYVHNVISHQLQNPTIEICCKKWYNCLINKLVKQIIPYGQQNGHSAQHDVGQLWHVYSIVFQNSTPHTIIHWHIHIAYLLLFFHQNHNFITGSLTKMHF